MPLTDFKLHKRVAGSPGAQHYLISFKGPASYTQYGETMTADRIGAPWIWSATTAVGYNASGNATHLANFYISGQRGEGGKTGKWVIQQLSDGAEVAGSTDLSAVTFQSTVHGG